MRVIFTVVGSIASVLAYEQATLLEKNKNIELMASPSIMQRYISMNVTQKPFDNPKVREALNYAINRPALVKVAFAGYAVLNSVGGQFCEANSGDSAQSASPVEADQPV